MSASVCVYVVFVQSFPLSSRQKSCPITLQLESLITDEHGTRKEGSCKNRCPHKLVRHPMKD